MSNNKGNSSGRQALSLIGQNANKTLSNDMTAKNSQEILGQNILFKNTSALENQSNMSKTTVFLAQNQQSISFNQKTSHQVSPLEQTLKNALKEAIDENEILRKRVMELEALFAAAEDEIEKKDKAILELYEALEKQNELTDSNRKKTLENTEAFMKDPENLITVQLKGKNKNKENKKNQQLLNSSF